MKKLVLLGAVVVMVLGIFVFGKKILVTGTESTEKNLITYESWCNYADEHYTLYALGRNEAMYKDQENGIYYVYKKDHDNCKWSSYSDLYYANKDFFGRED